MYLEVYFAVAEALVNICAAQYLRMSSDEQPMSIDIQKAAIALYAKERGIQIVRTYADEARTGVTLAGRCGMQQLLRDVTKPDCPFKLVLVLDISRWGRFQDVDESAYHEYHCRKNGVGVEYVSEPFGHGSMPLDSIWKHLKRAMAAEYSRELAIKARAGQIHVVTRGFTTGSMPCLGYRRQAYSNDGTPKEILSHAVRKPMATDHTRWVLGPECEQAMVRRIFREYTGGIPLNRIARNLNAEGVTTHAGRKFTAHIVRTLVDNEIVLGNFEWGTRRRFRSSVTNISPLPKALRIEGLLPPLISLDQWNAARARSDRAVAFKRSGYGEQELLQRLRDAFAKNPTLSYYGFPDAKLPSTTTYAQHFGSLAQAYAQAGRKQTGKQLAFFERSAAAQQLRKRLAADVLELLLNTGLQVQARPTQNSIVLRGVEIKICAARRVGRGRPRWRIAGARAKSQPGNWLLILRLNPDGQTGQDFFLLPPSELTNFSGCFDGDTAEQWGRFKARDATELLKLLRVVPRACVPHQHRENGARSK